MPLPLRDQHRHTYAEYCSWPEDVRYSVICDRTKLDDRGCRGAPDWVIEVLSPSSASHDQIVKRALYERHGVREFWLIHPVDLVVTVYRLADGAYGRPDIYELKDTLPCGILPEVVIDWARVLRED